MRLEGIAAARCTVERLMCRLGLQGARRGKKVRTTVSDDPWSYVRCKSNPRWLFYAHDRIRKRVLAHVFAPRTALTLLRLLALLSKFSVAFYMADAWPVYKTLLRVTSHVVSKKYTQRIECHNLNLRTHIKRLARKTICFSKPEVMHDKNHRLVPDDPSLPLN